MDGNGTGKIGMGRWTFGGVCLLLAFFFFGQILGLLLIHRIADKAAEPNAELRIPLSVRLVAYAADRLHRDVLNQPLRPDQSNWPFGFRVFFTLELCGLAGICLAFTQLGVGAIKRRRDWTTRGRGILGCSLLAVVVGIGFLKLIRPSPEMLARPRSSSAAALIQALKDGDSVARRRAAQALGGTGDFTVVKPLKELLVNENEIEVRLAAATSLVQLGEPLDLDWVAPIIKSRGPVFSDAIWLVRRNAGDRAAPTLIRCLDMEDPSTSNFYNYTLVWQIAACGGPEFSYQLLNENATAEQREQNRKVLAQLQAWIAAQNQSRPSTTRFQRSGNSWYARS